VLFAQAEERAAVDLGVAADEIMQAGMEALPVATVPGFLGLIFGVDEHLLGAPVIVFALEVVAAFEEQDPLARRSEPQRQGPAACARADDDHVVAAVAHRSSLDHP